MMSHGMGRPFGQLGSAVLAVSPLHLLLTPSLLATAWVGRTSGPAALMLGQPWCCASTAQPQPKHRQGVREVLAARAEYGTVWAAVGTVTSLPVLRAHSVFFISSSSHLEQEPLHSQK